MRTYSGTRYASGRNFNYYKKPFYKTKGFYLLIIILLAIAGFIYWSISRTEKPADDIVQKYSDSDEAPVLAAKITSAEGKVEIQSPGSDWLETAENYQVKSGDSVRTGDKARTIIELPDKSLLRVNENTEIELTQIGLSDIIINQKNGEVFHRVNDQSPAIYRVKHDNVELTALGTGFNINISNGVTHLVVTENKVKAKVYRNEDILNMRTIDEGTEAFINPSLEVDKMIDSKAVNAGDLLGQPWYSWNLEQDTKNNFYLGLFAKATKLVITEPESSEFSTDKDALTIKGTTDPDAEIYIDGQEVENKSGSFEMNYKLAAKVNEITITVKKDKNINKKILKVTSTKIPDAIKLDGSAKDDTINLSWTMTEIKDADSLKVLKNTKTGAITYPAEKEHTVKLDSTKDSWPKLSSGSYSFRLCAYSEKEGCKIYSNQISVSINDKTAQTPPAETEKPTAETTTTDKGYILLSGNEADNAVTLNWLISDFSAPQGVYIIMSNNSNVIFPGREKVSVLSGSSYTWSNLAPGQTYYFRVCESLTNKCGRYSNEYSATIK